MQQVKEIKEKILSVLGDAEILLIIPPFGSINDICLGPHILQSLAKEHGYTVDILYLNMLLASVIGTERYHEIYNAPLFWMLGERLFARSAYGLPPLGKHPEWCTNESLSIRGSNTCVTMFYDTHQHFDLDEYGQTEQICKAFLDDVIAIICSLNYNIIGCTTAHTGQTNCCIALLAGIKKQSPDRVTIIGGRNCAGEMAEGIVSLNDTIDYIFSGESETAFLNFLEAYSAQKLPSQRIVTGEPLRGLEDLPLAEYKTFFKQYTQCFGENAFNKVRVWYETSRGCWWGQKSQCTFCSEQHIAYRQKSINTVVHDIKRIRTVSSTDMLFITDIIMPYSYHKELLPVIRKQKEFPSLNYMLRADHNLQDLINLKNAKIEGVVVGIETFSADLLKLMKKGVTGRQSLLFLRNARSVGIHTDWFLLWGFPGDKISDYEDVLHLLPLIRHLQAPRMFFPMTLERFSPYFEKPHEYNIRNARPWAVFSMIYPDWADREKLAYYYIGDYPSEAYENPEIIREIANEVALWKKTWKQTKLVMERFMNTYVIYDNRNLHEQEKTHILEDQQAKEIMTSHVYTESENLQWAIEEKLGVVLDSWYVPLVTALPELLLEFEELC